MSRVVNECTVCSLVHSFWSQDRYNFLFCFHKDDEGHICTSLTGATLEDFLENHGLDGEVIRLRVCEKTEVPKIVLISPYYRIGTNYKWQVFLGPSQGWTDFTEPHASHLNKALANGFSWTTLNYFDHAGGEWRYMIDLQGMTQKN